MNRFLCLVVLLLVALCLTAVGVNTVYGGSPIGCGDAISAPADTPDATADVQSTAESRPKAKKPIIGETDNFHLIRDNGTIAKIVHRHDEQARKAAELKCPLKRCEPNPVDQPKKSPEVADSPRRQRVPVGPALLGAAIASVAAFIVCFRLTR